MLPEITGLFWARLPEQSVNVVAQAETRHVCRVHRHREQELITAQIHLGREGIERRRARGQGEGETEKEGGERGTVGNTTVRVC